MIASPLIQKLMSSRPHKDILGLLETRFGNIRVDRIEQNLSVVDYDRLTELVSKAVSCPNLESFREVGKFRSSDKTSR